MEIISILIIAAILVVGFAILFYLVRLCTRLSTSQTNRESEINRLTNESNSHASTITDLNQRIASLEAGNLTNPETTADLLSQWNETITEIRQEISCIPVIHIRAQWPFPNASPERIEELREIAQNNYPQYLSTNEWTHRANNMRRFVGGRCQACNSPGPLEVHHRHYLTIGHERPLDLTVLCRECHQLIHNNREIDGIRRPIQNNNGDC
ncbi:hypothetical protein C6499_19260 [Candidatus Poribacteria bacterium]|nr:MAG: hypothetical protein C6499_19260 [Candidatus Poribacteria bacterium]